MPSVGLGGGGGFFFFSHTHTHIINETQEGSAPSAGHQNALIRNVSSQSLCSGYVLLCFGLVSLCSLLLLLSSLASVFSSEEMLLPAHLVSPSSLSLSFPRFGLAKPHAACFPQFWHDSALMLASVEKLDMAGAGP